MKTAPTHLIALLTVMAAACGGNSPDTERSSPALLGDDDSADPVAIHLASSTRQLVEAVAIGDSATMGRLMTPDTRAMDFRPPTPEAAAGAPPEFGYFEIMAGSLAERIGPHYNTYHTIPETGSATVYAIGNTYSLRTSWTHDGTDWTASRIVMLGSASALKNLETERTP